MLIFFVRHGLTDYNIERRFQGSLDIPLNADGVRQAETAAARCRELRLERIYHSTLARAAETARIIANASGAPLIPCKGFNEVSLGAFQGLNHDEAKAQYPVEYAHYFADRVNAAPPQGESLFDVQQRALVVQRQLHGRLDAFLQRGDTAVFVSRGGILIDGLIMALEVVLKIID